MLKFSADFYRSGRKTKTLLKNYATNFSTICILVPLDMMDVCNPNSGTIPETSADRIHLYTRQKKKENQQKIMLKKWENKIKYIKNMAEIRK